MTTDEMNFIKLLPAFMQADGAIEGLASGINKISAELKNKIKLLATWDAIDIMQAAELDSLAEELHIAWYKKDASLSVKRDIIRQSDIVHSKLGTNWACEQVINTYFGEGKVIDWFEYDGQPGHFIVETVNQSIITEKANEFLSVLDSVKRKGAILDRIDFTSSGTCKLNCFIASTECEIMETVVQRT